MTPAKTGPTPSSTPTDQRLLEQVMACDAFLHSSSVRDRIDSTPPLSTETEDRGRRRLLLLLTMLDAADTATEASKGKGADRGRQAPREKRLLLGRFEVIDEIGSGGFGFVVRAQDLRLGREVALKMPLPERGAEARRRPPVPQRGQSRGPARPSSHRAGLRRGGAEPLRLLHSVGVSAGPRPAPLAPGPERAGSGATGGALAGRPRRCRPACPRPGHPPPRHQARQRDLDLCLRAGRIHPPLD